MSTQRTIETYTFDELDEKAKERAREWWRNEENNDEFWSEGVIDDAKNMLGHLGFTIDRVYFRGFWSQGDGACFEGSWHAFSCNALALKAEAPIDKVLHQIADDVQAFATQYPGASLTVKHRGHYSHKYETVFDVRNNDEEDNDLDIDETPIIEASRDAMDWIYQSLKDAYEYQDADERVDENIRANAYKFTKEGKRTFTL